MECFFTIQPWKRTSGVFRGLQSKEHLILIKLKISCIFAFFGFLYISWFARCTRFKYSLVVEIVLKSLKNILRGSCGPFQILILLVWGFRRNVSNAVTIRPITINDP